SHLNFQIDAGAGSLNFGAARLTSAHVNIAGGPHAPFSFAGDAKVSFNAGPEENVSVTYDPTTHLLSFNSLVNSLSELRFTDHLVLFDAGIGLSFNTTRPAGDITTVGKVGLFAKHALGTRVTDDDFQLVIKDAQTKFSFDAANHTGTFKV